MIVFWAVFETIQQRKKVLLILLSKINPYTFKVGDLSGYLDVYRFPGTIITAYTLPYNAVSTFTMVIFASSI